MPKNAVVLNGFAGGINQDADETDIITVGEGKDEVLECENLLLDQRGKIVSEYPQVISLTGVAGATCTETAAWTDGTYNVPFVQHQTSGTGTGMKIICKVASNNVGTNFWIIDGGTGHAVNDDIQFRNPSGDNTNVKTFRVNSINSASSYTGNGNIGLHHALGISIHANANVNKNRLLYFDDVLYQEEGVYKIGPDINWSGNADYLSLTPKNGAYNKPIITFPTGLDSGAVTASREWNGFDFALEPSGLDTADFLFLGKNATINSTQKIGRMFNSKRRDGSQDLGSTGWGAENFVRGVISHNGNGNLSYGDHAGWWFDGGTNQGMFSISTLWNYTDGPCIFCVKDGHTEASKALIDFSAGEITTSNDDVANDGTGAGATTLLAASEIQEFDFFTWAYNGDETYAATDTTGQNKTDSEADVPADARDEMMGLLFKVGYVETTANNDAGKRNGPYADSATSSSMANNPSWEGQDINIELKVLDKSNIQKIFIIADTGDNDLHVTGWDSTNPDDNTKQWNITSNMIVDSGADTDWARITIPWDSAIHTGGDFNSAEIRTWAIIPRVPHEADLRGTEIMRVREFGFTKTEKYGWDGRYFKFYSTRINNKIESIPYEYGADYGHHIFQGQNYPQKFTITRSNANDQFSGKLYYSEVTEDGVDLGNKFLIAEVSYDEGVKKAGNESFTPWDTSNAASIEFNDPPVVSTYELESGYPYGVNTINTLWKTAATVGRQAYIGNVAEEKGYVQFIGGDNGSTYNATNDRWCQYPVEVISNPGSDSETDKTGTTGMIRFSDYFINESFPWTDKNEVQESSDNIQGYKKRLNSIVNCDLLEQGFEVGQLISTSGFSNSANNDVFEITAIESEGARGVAMGGSLSTWSITTPVDGTIAAGASVASGLFDITIKDPRGVTKTFVVHNLSDKHSLHKKPDSDGSGKIVISIVPSGSWSSGSDYAAGYADRITEAINYQRTNSIANNSSDYVDVTASDQGVSSGRGVVHITANQTGAADQYPSETATMVVTARVAEGMYDLSSEAQTWKFNNLLPLSSGDGITTPTSYSASDSTAAADGFSKTFTISGGSGKFGTYENNVLRIQKVGGDNAGLTDEQVSSTSRIIKVVAYDSTADDANSYYQQDKMLKSAIGKPGGFPDNLFIDLELGGDTIVHLVSSADRLFIFTQRKLVIVNVAGDIEFLEATMDHMGIVNSKQVCKVGEGVAFVNNTGAYFFDGEQMQALADLRLNTLSIDKDNCSIGYDANRSILYVWSEATKVYFYSFVTQSWIGRTELSAPFNVEPDTNIVNGRHGMSYFEQGGKYYAIGATNAFVDNSAGGIGSCRLNNVHLETGRMGLGNLAQNKKFYKVNINLENGIDNNMRLYWRTNETMTTYWNDLADTDSGTDNGINLPNGTGLNEIKLSGARGKWIQLKLMSKTTSSNAADGAAPLDMSVGDISVVFRGRIIK